MLLIGATVCEIPAPSLQLLQTYCVPVPLVCGDVVLIVCDDPAVQDKFAVVCVGEVTVALAGVPGVIQIVLFCVNACRHGVEKFDKQLLLIAALILN